MTNETLLAAWRKAAREWNDDEGPFERTVARGEALYFAGFAIVEALENGELVTPDRTRPRKATRTETRAIREHAIGVELADLFAASGVAYTSAAAVRNVIAFRAERLSDAAGADGTRVTPARCFNLGLAEIHKRSKL